MSAKKLTAQAVENAEIPAKGRSETWDTLVRGLGLRVTDRGSKSWVVMYRVNGRQRRLTLGSYPALKLADARGLAREALSNVAKGFDPAAEKKASREAGMAEPPETVQVAIGEFIERYAKPKNRSWHATERIFERYVLPRWGRRSLESITRRDVIALMDEIMDQGLPYMANRVLASVRRLFNWCLERDKVSASPVANVKPPGAEVARDRILSEDEIRAVWRSWEAMGWPFGLAFKFLLITGQRRDEVAGMCWSDIDLEGKVWTLPREFTKSDRLHEVPLSPLAIEILEAVPRMGDYVFTTTGNRPISGFSKAKQRTVKLSEIRDWRLHDLRRTAASGMARLSIAPHVVEKVLNHASGTISGVAAIYNRHGYTEEKRHALNTWSRAVETIIRPGHDNVVPLQSEGRL